MMPVTSPAPAPITPMTPTAQRMASGLLQSEVQLSDFPSMMTGAATAPITGFTSVHPPHPRQRTSAAVRASTWRNANMPSPEQTARRGCRHDPRKSRMRATAPCHRASSPWVCSLRPFVKAPGWLAIAFAVVDLERVPPVVRRVVAATAHDAHVADDARDQPRSRADRGHHSERGQDSFAVAATAREVTTRVPEHDDRPHKGADHRFHQCAATAANAKSERCGEAEQVAVGNHAKPSASREESVPDGGQGIPDDADAPVAIAGTRSPARPAHRRICTQPNPSAPTGVLRSTNDPWPMRIRP